jgi:heavy metal sensor kinase
MMIKVKSLRFRMSLWYAIVLSACLAFYGASMYIGVSGYLYRTLRKSVEHDARTIADKVLPNVSTGGVAYLKREIDQMYPEVTARFIRISTGSGEVLYVSPQPFDKSFDPRLIPFVPITETSQFARSVVGAGRAPILLDVLPYTAPGGERYFVEVGANTLRISTIVRGLGLSLLLGVPILIVIAIGGGILVTSNAMQPLDDIAERAERITSRNFGERLPVIESGDELERLTISLNRMIVRLQDAFEHIERFSADVSHELRTPLSILRAERELLLNRKDVPADVHDKLAASVDEIDRLTRIVSQLLEISQLKAGAIKADPHPIDLGKLAVDTAEQMLLLAEIKQIKVIYDIQPDCYIEGDGALLRQVTANLLDNAIKYTPEGGIVKVATRRSGPRSVLEIEDTGIGIAEHDLPKLCEPFYRADEARSRTSAGAGLGLAIVKSICTAHAADIKIASTVGAGTKVSIEFRAVPLPTALSTEESLRDVKTP